MKKIIAISSVLLGVVFLAGCSQQPVSQTQPTVLAPVAQAPTQPVVTQPVSIMPVNEAVDWKQFDDSIYRITFLYPPKARIFREINPGIFFEGENIKLAIEPVNYDAKEIKKWDIKKTAEEIWTMNKNDNDPNIKNHTVSSLEKIILAGRDAYKFSATGSYVDLYEQTHLYDETTYIFTTNINGVKLRLSYPNNASHIEKIIESLKFY